MQCNVRCWLYTYGYKIVHESSNRVKLSDFWILGGFSIQNTMQKTKHITVYSICSQKVHHIVRISSFANIQCINTTIDGATSTRNWSFCIACLWLVAFSATPNVWAGALPRPILCLWWTYSAFWGLCYRSRCHSSPCGPWVVSGALLSLGNPLCRATAWELSW